MIIIQYRFQYSYNLFQILKTSDEKRATLLEMEPSCRCQHERTYHAHKCATYTHTYIINTHIYICIYIVDRRPSSRDLYMISDCILTICMHRPTHINIHTYISVYTYIQDVTFSLSYLFLASRILIVQNIAFMLLAIEFTASSYNL